MKVNIMRKISIILLCVIVISNVGSIAPASAGITQALYLSDDFIMVQVNAGCTPLTASLPNVTWTSSDYATAQYDVTQAGVKSTMQGGYAKIEAKVGNTSASCDVCSYYSQVLPSGTYYISSGLSNRFLTVGSSSIIQQNIGTSLQKWTVTPTDDGYYTLCVSYKCSYLACNTTGSTPTLTETYDSTSESAKWIIKLIKYDDTEDQYILMPKTLASDGYMLSVDATNNTNGGDLILQKWNQNTHTLCGWSFHDAYDAHATIPEWKTNVTTIAYHSGDINTYLFFHANSSTPSYTALQSNFYTGYSTASNQWNNALDISITADSLSTATDILVYGVTSESYQSLTGKVWSDVSLGSTTSVKDEEKGYSFVQNTNKKIYIWETTELVTMYILLDTDSSLIDAVFTHEMGHAIGFEQHSSNSTHIMYRIVTESGTGYNCTVSESEAHDLKLIYDRYN